MTISTEQNNFCLDPWGNPESPVMTMQRQWRSAEDRCAQYYQTTNQLQKEIYKAESKCRDLQEQVYRLTRELKIANSLVAEMQINRKQCNA